MEKLMEHLNGVKHCNIFILTGAGISAESGIKTFRDFGGLWNEYSIEEVATPEAFKKNPDLVYRFYNERRRQLLKSHPNAAHEALAEIEGLIEDKLYVVTQNVDDLHERAGLKNLLHMHGELLKARCLECQSVYEWKEDLDSSSKCINCGSKMRPHIVWFNEMPFHMDTIYNKLQNIDLFVSIGTSGQVYPAAGFVSMAQMSGAFTLEINLEKSGNIFSEAMIGPATEKLREFVDVIKNNSHIWK